MPLRVRLEQLGLTMYGQMTAGSWIYIGTQGILQGTYETFSAIAKKRFNDSLQGTLTLTSGCGGMGGTQPLDGCSFRYRHRSDFGATVTPRSDTMLGQGYCRAEIREK